jgi:Mrp family chromosome partitioning ATPase/capsular polysaccharide biosynthesis protein
MSISFLFTLRRRWPLLVVLPVLAAIVVALLPTEQATTSYRATEAVAVQSSSGFSAARQAVYLVKQEGVTTRAAKILGVEPSTAVAGRIRVSPDDESVILAFSATGDDPAEVTRYVHAFATAFVQEMSSRNDADSVSRAEQAQRQYQQAKDAYEQFLRTNGAALSAPTVSPALAAERDQLNQAVQDARGTLSQVTANSAQTGTTYRALGVTPAETVSSSLSVFNHRWVRALAAALAALVLAAGLAALLERFNPRVDDRETAEEITGVPVLTMVPFVNRRRWRQRFARPKPSTFTGPFAESYRALRSHLEFLDRAGEAAANGNGNGNADAPARRGTVVAVLSPTPQDGKSVTTAYLAVAYAESGPDPLVLSCDFRRPTIHRLLGLDLSPGFSDLRAKDGGVDMAGLLQRDPVTGVSMISSGRPTSRTTDLLADVRVVTDTASGTGREVVIDTAPILVASDAVDLAGLADHILLVVRAGRTSQRSVREAVISLGLNERKITGVVMIGSREADEASHYYYGYYDEPSARAIRKQEKREAAAPTEPVDAG